MWTIKDNGESLETNPSARFVVFKKGSKSWNHYYAFPTLEEAQEKLESIIRRLSRRPYFELGD